MPGAHVHVILQALQARRELAANSPLAPLAELDKQIFGDKGDVLGLDNVRTGDCWELVFRPAEVGESLLETGEREADDVEVATFDARNEAAGAALDGVGAGFVVRFVRGEVAGDFFVIKLGEMDVGRFDESAALGVGKADEGDTGEDGVRAAGKFFKHVAGVAPGARLAADVDLEFYPHVPAPTNPPAQPTARPQVPPLHRPHPSP